jgi:hypothetical protein
MAGAIKPQANMPITNDGSQPHIANSGVPRPVLLERHPNWFPSLDKVGQ